MPESSNVPVDIVRIEFCESGLVPKDAFRGGWRSQLGQVSEELGWVDGSFVSVLAKLCDHMLALCASINNTRSTRGHVYVSVSYIEIE